MVTLSIDKRYLNKNRDLASIILRRQISWHAVSPIAEAILDAVKYDIQLRKEAINEVFS